MMSFFQSHYEKIILASLLVIFAILLVWQVNFLQAAQSQNVDNIINKVEPDSDQSPYDFSKEKKFQIPFIFLDDVSWHPEPKVNELPHPKTDLFSSFHLSVCPFCYNLVPSAYFPELGSTAVNPCPICRKELKARQKKTEQKGQEVDFTATANNDKNSNGAPDDWEKANGVYADSSAAIDEDPDRDGFSSYEECVLRTDPQDPKSHPPYIAYTSVRRIGRNRISEFHYRGLASIGETDVAKLELNIEYREHGWKRPRTKVKKLGEKFKHRNWTFQIVKVVPDDPRSPGQGTIIFVRRDGYDEEIKCEPNRTVYDPVETVDLWSPWKDKVSCQVGKTFRLGDARTGVEEYTLVSASADSAEAVNSKGAKFMLKKHVPGKPIVEKRTSAGENPEGAAVRVPGRDRDLLQPLELSPSGKGAGKSGTRQNR